MEACSIAVVGATGAVGRVFLDVLEERNFPVSDIRLCASERSVGKKLKCMGEEIAVEMATPQLFSEVDFVFISASGDVSRALAPVAAKQGAVVIDDSSAFRMDPMCLWSFRRSTAKMWKTTGASYPSPTAPRRRS